jgi:hypothetical protein
MNDLIDNILEQADQIINHRSEEKDRQYGPFEEGMRRAAMICSGMTGKQLTGADMYAALVALKLSRHSYNYKQDNLLDAAAYIGGLDNYIQKYGYKETEKPLETGDADAGI